MQKINYDKITDEIIEKLRADGIRKRLLLHACCAPCASACIERLKDDFDLTVYFYNPNMDCDEEYLLRLKEAQRLCNEFGVGFLSEEFIHQDFLDCVKGFECALEGGARCQKCFDLRLKKTAEKAKELGFDYFTTTLTISPLKNATLLNQLGQKIAEQVGTEFLPTDFKKKGGYQRSIELSKQYGLYRQNYCGCEFSKR